MIYLDNAATSFPKPDSVYARIDHVLRNIGGNPGRASHRMALEAMHVVFDAREAVARLIGAPDSSRVSFTKNATEGVNIILKGLSLGSSDHMVTTSFEHNSVSKTVRKLEKDGVKVTRVRPGADGLLTAADFEKAFTPQTKVLCMAHASNVFGALQPIDSIGALCRKKGAVFIVDGAQTLGAMPVDVQSQNIDVLVATGHKALFGPQGTGFLYVKEGIEPQALINGGTGEADNVLEMPERLESGTMNMPGIAGLHAGVEFVMAQGADKVRAREEALIGGLLTGLARIKGLRIIGPVRASQRASLVAFNIDGRKPAEVGSRLDKDYSIMVRTGAHCAPDAHREAKTHPEGAVRVSPGYFNTPADIDDFIRAVKEIAGSRASFSTGSGILDESPA